MLNEEIDSELENELKKRLRWTKYQEKDILIQDYSKLPGDDIARLMSAIADQIIKSGKKDLLIIVDVTDGIGNKAAIGAFGKYSKLLKPVFKKTAVLGIDGVKKIFLNAINKLSDVGATPFDSYEEAKEWLISE